jgi:hypothetical protein
MLRIFCLNSIKERISNLPLILPNILEQCDVLHINTIGYSLNLNELGIDNKEKIKLHEFDSLGSEGRLLYYNQYDDGTFYFTIDDDILYPKDFSVRLIEFLTTNNESIVCVHGSNIIDKSEPNYNKRIVYKFNKELESPTIVELPGVGTTCFKIGGLKINQLDFKIKNMSDPYIGFFAKAQNIEIFCINRLESWLIPLNEFGVRIHGNNPIKEINELLKEFFN